MRLGIVGYRNYNDYENFCIEVNKYLNGVKPEMIISGGATGVDTMAQRYAQEYNIKMEIYLAEWNKYGKKAGPLRNSQIIKYSTDILAFVSKKSIGTIDTINKAIKENKKIKIINLD